MNLIFNKSWHGHSSRGLYRPATSRRSMAVQYPFATDTCVLLANVNEICICTAVHVTLFLEKNIFIITIASMVSGVRDNFKKSPRRPDSLLPSHSFCTLRKGASDRVKEDEVCPMGASINDVHKMFGFFDPPCPHFELIYCIKFTQSPLLCPLFHEPPPPLMRTSYLDAP